MAKIKEVYAIAKERTSPKVKVVFKPDKVEVKKPEEKKQCS